MARFLKVSALLIALGALAVYLYRRYQEAGQTDLAPVAEFPEIPRRQAA
mgnify:CR=1 FL=1